MPEMTALGWFHTILGIGALATGIVSFARFKLIAWAIARAKFIYCAPW